MLDWTYKDFQEKQGDLDYEEFIDKIWNDGVSEKVVSSAYYAENEDFILGLTYDQYRLFQMSSNLTLRIVIRMTENFFFNLFRFKGANSDVENSELEN